MWYQIELSVTFHAKIIITHKSYNRMHTPRIHKSVLYDSVSMDGMGVWSTQPKAVKVPSDIYHRHWEPAPSPLSTTPSGEWLMIMMIVVVVDWGLSPNKCLCCDIYICTYNKLVLFVAREGRVVVGFVFFCSCHQPPPPPPTHCKQSIINHG